MASAANYPMTTRMAERLDAAISQWQSEEIDCDEDLCLALWDSASCPRELMLHDARLEGLYQVA